MAGTSFAMAANAGTTANITGLASTTSYNLYFVASDTAGNLAQMKFVAFTTTATTGTTGATTGTATTGGSPP
jgi:chitodextrinase